jgi:hypothetical protein
MHQVKVEGCYRRPMKNRAYTAYDNEINPVFRQRLQDR